MSDRSFDTGGGIVISLNDVLAGGKEAVLKSLRQDLELAESDASEAVEELEVARERIVKWELELARANARREAVEVALKAAEKAFE